MSGEWRSAGEGQLGSICGQSETSRRANLPWFGVIAVNPRMGAVRVELEVGFDFDLCQLGAVKV